MTQGRPNTALVLSGGGMRGAYEVGVLQGMVEILELRPEDPAPFQTFVGTSVGALNASWLAAHGHRGDLGIDGLVRIWLDLKLRRHLQLDLFGWWRPLRRKLRGDERRRAASTHPGQALLDPTPLDDLVRDALPWEALHDNIDRGVIRGLITPALNVSTGQTWVFAELAPGVQLTATRDPFRRAVPTRITPDHVLASAAIPAIFPPRRVDGHYFYDGGVRFNTPIAPAIRTGAERLVVISPIRTLPAPARVYQAQPELGFLAGKLLNAVIQDPVAHDLEVLGRFNELLGVLEEVVEPDELARIRQVMASSRGQAYRELELLAFQPGSDLGRLSVDLLRSSLDDLDVGRATRWFLRRLSGGQGSTSEADWVSYVLFDGALAERLIAVGRADALARADEILDFFCEPADNVVRLST